METQPLYDLAPLARLMLLGVLIALGPLVWIGWRHRGDRGQGGSRRLQALTVFTLFLTFDLVLFGAFTRLTDSGLGCPDWPGCYGSASPIGAKDEIHAAQTAMPTGPVTFSKAWIEMIHRYLATGVGVLIIALTVIAWVQHRRAGAEARAAALSPWWPTFTLVWVCMQGAFGALTVTMKLFPAIVTLHLMGGIGLLALLALQASRQSQLAAQRSTAALSRGLRALMWATLAAVVMQVALGGWVSTNYAVLACTEFPACQGQWWPPMDFRQGFEVWRELGKTGSGEHLTFAALTAIHYTHRLFAYVVFALLIALGWALRGTVLKTQARALLTIALLQFITGLSNVVLDWPLVAAVLHTGGAALLVTVLVWALAESRVAHGAAQGERHSGTASRGPGGPAVSA